MSGATKGVFEAALKLPPKERKELGKYWEGEIKRRMEDVDAGRVKTVPADEVFARLEQRFGGKST